MNVEEEPESFSHAAVQSVSTFTEYVSNLRQKYEEKNIGEMVKNMHDKKGMNYLHCACIYDSVEVIPILINDYNIDINAIDDDGYSPIFYSISNLDEECLKYLLKGKPKIDIQTKDLVIEATGFPIYICGGQTIFHLIAEKNELKCLKPLFKYLLDEYKNNFIQILMIKDKNGYNAMDIARMQNRKQILIEINGFITKHCKKNNDILNILNDDIPDDEIRKTMKREYEMKIRERITRNNTKYEKINEHSDVFKTEQTNYAVFIRNNENEEKKQEKQQKDQLLQFGMIREIKILDQFEDEEFIKLAQKYDKTEGICGHISICSAIYILEKMIKFNKQQNINKLIFDFDNKLLQQIIYNDLCNTKIIESVEKSIQFTLNWRNKYIEKNKDKFKTKDINKQYLKYSCSNFEISDYIQHEIKDEISKYIVFLRVNNWNQVKEAQYELKQRIIKDDKQFNDETFIVEMFAPRKLIHCKEFTTECIKRKINKQSILYIFDLNGHYNIGFSMKIKNERNIVMLDCYTANHVKNQTALKCFELTFDCVLNQNIKS